MKLISSIVVLKLLLLSNMCHYLMSNCQFKWYVRPEVREVTRKRVWGQGKVVPAFWLRPRSRAFPSVKQHNEIFLFNK
jgi:hypothetical protein